MKMLNFSGFGRIFFEIWSGNTEEARQPVLWIRIRMDPKPFPGSGIIVPDPNPGKNEKRRSIQTLFLIF